MKDVGLKLNFDPKSLFSKIKDFFLHKSTLIIFVIGFGFLGYCALIWYQNIYSYEWDEVKKQEYMNNKNAGTNLNRVKFEKALKDVERRKEAYDKNLENMKDIFRLKKKVVKVEVVEKNDESVVTEENLTPSTNKDDIRTDTTEKALEGDIPKKTE